MASLAAAIKTVEEKIKGNSLTLADMFFLAKVVELEEKNIAKLQSDIRASSGSFAPSRSSDEIKSPRDTPSSRVDFEQKYETKPKISSEAITKAKKMLAEHLLSFADFTQTVTKKLRDTVSSSEAKTDFAKLPTVRREAKKITALSDPIASRAMIAGMRHVEQVAVVTAAQLFETLHNWVHVLVSLDHEKAQENIEAILTLLFAKPSYPECVEAACKISLEQKDRVAQARVATVLLEKYCDKLNNAQLDALIKASLNETDSLSKGRVFLICRGQKSETNRIRLTAAMLRNRSMRDCILSSSDHFSKISSDLDAYCRDYADPALAQRDKEEKEYSDHLEQDNQRRHALIEGAKQLFTHWTKDDFTKSFSLSRDTMGTVSRYLHWGSLTRGDKNDFTDDELIKVVRELDLTTLSAGQIKALDKRSRIAVLKNFASWETAKQQLGSHDASVFQEKIKALVYDVEVGDISEPQYAEAALIALFGKRADQGAVADVILKRTIPLRKVAWLVLQEAEQGFLKGEEKGQYWGNQDWLKPFLNTSVYEFDEKKGYELSANKLIEKELENNPGGFIEAKTATPAAFKFFLSYPAVINSFANNKKYKPVSDQTDYWLKRYLDVAATNSHISPLELLTTIKTLKESKQQKEIDAGDALIAALPAFFAKNRQYTEKDLRCLLQLYDLYREAYPVAIDIKTAPETYATDPVISALKQRLDQTVAEKKANQGRRTLLGILYFREGAFLKGYLCTRKHHDREPEESKLIIYLRTFLWGMVIGGVIGAALYVGSKIASFFNPMNWFAGSSIWGKVLDVAKYVIGGVAVGLGGIGVGVALAGFLAVVIVGAATVGSAFVLLRGLYEGAESVGTRFIHGAKRWFNYDVPAPGQRDYDIVTAGLAHVTAAQFREMMYGSGCESVRDGMARALWYLSDKGFDINKEKSIPKEVLHIASSVKNQYKNKRKITGNPTVDVIIKGISDIPQTAIFAVSELFRAVFTAADRLLEAVGVGSLFNFDRLISPPYWVTYIECGLEANSVDKGGQKKVKQTQTNATASPIVSVESMLGVTPKREESKHDNEVKDVIIITPSSLSSSRVTPSPFGAALEVDPKAKLTKNL